MTGIFDERREIRIPDYFGGLRGEEGDDGILCIWIFVVFRAISEASLVWAKVTTWNVGNGEEWAERCRGPFQDAGQVLSAHQNAEEIRGKQWNVNDDWTANSARCRRAFKTSKPPPHSVAENGSRWSVRHLCSLGPPTCFGGDVPRMRTTTALVDS